MEIWKLRGSLRCLNKFVVQEVLIPPKCSPGFTILKMERRCNALQNSMSICVSCQCIEKIGEPRLLLFDTNMLFHPLPTSMVYIARAIFTRINTIYLIPLDGQSFPVRTFIAFRIEKIKYMFALFINTLRPLFLRFSSISVKITVARFRIPLRLMIFFPLSFSFFVYLIIVCISKHFKYVNF